MPSPSCLLAFAALMLAMPAFAAPAEAAPPQPYHPGDRPGHETLLSMDHGDHGDDRRWNRRDWKSGRFPRHGHLGRGHWGRGDVLPPRVVERQLRRHAFQPVGRIELRHGCYLVRAVDPSGRRVLLALDPASGAILGRQRGW